MDMIQMIKSFPNQILEQYENLKNEDLDLNKFNNIDNIIIVGMGGSAISGDLVNALTKNEIRIPRKIAAGNSSLFSSWLKYLKIA